MAEQCIVCLDALLHAEEPPPPLPDSTSPDSAEHASTPETTVRPNTDAKATEQPLAGRNAADDGIAAITGNDSHDDDHVAVIQICGHTLHDTCLREWTGKANSCPICRQSFHSVKVYDKIGGQLLSSYQVEDKKQVAEFDAQAWLDEYAGAEDEDVSTPCPVCNLADHEDVLLLCDGCDTPYHTHCIGLDSVPRGAWFCMECVDLLGDAIQAPLPVTPGSSVLPAGRRSRAPGRPRNDYFPRTRHTMRRARRRVRSDEWQGAWGQITGRIWDALNIDLDHDEDDALEEFRRVERLRDNERREFERWQERLDIARRLGAQDVFEQIIPPAVLHRANRQGGASQGRLVGGGPARAPQQTPEERRAWGALERARECDQTPTSRKRKSRSVTASPVEPPQEPERKLKRPRTRRIAAPSDISSSSKSPSLAPSRSERTTAAPAASAGAGASGAVSAASNSAAPVVNGASSSTNGTNGINGSSAVPAASSPGNSNNVEPRSFLSSLLKEVEMSTPSDDENIRTLFGDSRPPAVDPSSPVASSPAASAYNSPRALSTTPPPNRMLRPSSPTLLSSHIEPIYPPANYSPNRAGASSPDNSDSEGNNVSSTTVAASSSNGNGHNNHNNTHVSHRRSPPAAELRQPRPRRMPIVPLPRSQDVSPTRNSLSLETKESISGIVRSALNPHWKSSQLTADQYAAINRDVSHKLYEEVTNPAAIDADVRKTWEQKATREVARAVADLQA